MGLARDLSAPEFPPRHSKIICHDNASTGFPTWAPLFDGSQPRGAGCFDGRALQIMSEDRPTTGDNAAQFHTSAWLNRLTWPAGATKIYLRWEWGAEIFRGTNFTKGFAFGLDIDDGGDPGNFAPANGRRKLMMMRCTMFDESETKYYGGKWQYQTGDANAPSFADFTANSGADKISPFAFPRIGVGQNYNKLLRQVTEQVFDISALKYEGLRHNGIGFGSLPDGSGHNAAVNTKNTNMPSVSPAASIDDQFVNGFNIYAQIDNRSTQPSKSKLYIYDVLGVAF
jgi:hypothetical protein